LAPAQVLEFLRGDQNEATSTMEDAVALMRRYEQVRLTRAL